MIFRSEVFRIARRNKSPKFWFNTLLIGYLFVSTTLAFLYLVNSDFVSHGFLLMVSIFFYIFLNRGTNLLYTVSRGSPFITPMFACADPESFVNGGPTLASFFFFLVDERSEDPSTTISGQSSARQRNAI